MAPHSKLSRRRRRRDEQILFGAAAAAAALAGSAQSTTTTTFHAFRGQSQHRLCVWPVKGEKYSVGRGSSNASRGWTTALLHSTSVTWPEEGSLPETSPTAYVCFLLRPHTHTRTHAVVLMLTRERVELFHVVVCPVFGRRTTNIILRGRVKCNVFGVAVGRAGCGGSIFSF